MVTIGVDAHKRVHMAVVIDAQGHELASWRGENTPAGWTAMQTWAQTFDETRRWGIEGAGQYGHGLAQTVVAAGDRVLEVNPRLTAGMRRGSRARGKSDRLDALAVARVVVQAGDELPVVGLDDVSTVLAELTADRESATAEATLLRNQLHQVLHQLSQVDAQAWPDLTDVAAVERLTTYEPPATDALTTSRTLRVRHLATRLALALRHAAETAAAIVAIAQPQLGPLQEICGVGALTAGMLAAHLGGRHFASDAQLASYAGVAPLEASSGEQTRHRLNRTGNRHLNALLHRIVLVQSRCSPQAQTYLAKKQQEGKTKREARRALKRHLARVVFRAWQRCTLPPLDQLSLALI